MANVRQKGEMKYVQIEKGAFSEEFPELDFVNIEGAYHLIAVFRRRDIEELIKELQSVVVRKGEKNEDE